MGFANKLAFEAAGDLDSIRNEVLLSRVLGLANEIWRNEMQLLPYLSELARRKLYLDKGYPSLFAFCTGELKFPESSTWRYIAAATAVKEHPQLKDLLASHKIHMTGVAMIAAHLKDPNTANGRIELACGKTKAQLNGLIANWAGKPAARVKDSIRPVADLTNKNDNKARAQSETAPLMARLKFADDQSKEPTGRMTDVNAGCADEAAEKTKPGHGLRAEEATPLNPPTGFIAGRTAEPTKATSAQKTGANNAAEATRLNPPTSFIAGATAESANATLDQKMGANTAAEATRLNPPTSFIAGTTAEPTKATAAQKTGANSAARQNATDEASSGTADTPRPSSNCSGSLGAAALSLKPVVGSSTQLKEDAPGPVVHEEEKIRRVIVTFEADGALAEQIARAKEVMARHPKGNSLGAIVSEALSILLSKLDPLEKAARSEASQARKSQKAAKQTGKTSEDTTSSEAVSQTSKAQASVTVPSGGAAAKDSAVIFTLITRYIPAEVRHAVVARAGGQCEYVSKEGRRCCCKLYLELDHVVPFSLGGKSTVENLRVLCAAHNRHRAEQTFGVFKSNLKKKTTYPPTAAVAEDGNSVNCRSSGSGLTGESG